VATQIHGDETVPPRKLGTHLAVPGEPALRAAVEKQDRWSL